MVEKIFHHKEKQIKICFVDFYSGATKDSNTFIKNDYKILKKYYKINYVSSPKKFKIYKWILYQLKLLKKIKRSDIIFSWFASWHSAFAVFYSKLLRKKTIIVAGGYDVLNIPDINYGAFSNIKEKIPAKYVLKNADIVLAVSEYTKKKLLENVTPKKINIIYNGVKIEKFKKEQKRKFIVTIGKVTKKHIKIKGLDTFTKASRYFPDYEFIIIGNKEKYAADKLKKINPNIKLLGRINHEKVIDLLKKAKIYCQLSIIESFGLGIAESMVCGCIAIVTKRGAIKEVVGNTGFYVKYDDEKETVEALKKALKSNNKRIIKARKRIRNNYSLKKREKELIKVIDNLQ